MRLSTAQYLEKEMVTVSIRNNNAALAILDGQPVFMDTYDVATNLGVDVKNAVEAANLGFMLGIAKTQKVAGIAKGELNEAVVYGFTDAIVVRRTRTASGENWTTAPAITAGDLLIPETDFNYFTQLTAVTLSVAIASASATNVSNSGTGSVDIPVERRVRAAQSAVSIATATSTYLGTALAQTSRLKVFIRQM